jgi:hypothetical protein
MDLPPPMRLAASADVSASVMVTARAQETMMDHIFMTSPSTNFQRWVKQKLQKNSKLEFLKLSNT